MRHGERGGRLRPRHGGRARGRAATLALFMAVIPAMTLGIVLSGPAPAQEAGQGGALALSPADRRAETLADIRQELTQLAVEIRRLRRELATTGQGGLGGMPAGSLPARVQALEEEVARLTGKTEALERRIRRIAEDGARRIRDLEYRLVELEGGDVTKLANGGTTLLGGEAGEEVSSPEAPPAAAGAQAAGGDAAIGEEADFSAAEKAFAEGDYARAADLYARVATDYPGGAYAPRALYRRGEALEALGQHAGAARAFLDAYSSDPRGDRAPDALYRLGVELAHLGKTEEACLTLREVPRRHGGTAAADKAKEEMKALSCPAE